MLAGAKIEKKIMLKALIFARPDFINVYLKRKEAITGSDLGGQYWSGDVPPTSQSRSGAGDWYTPAD